MRGQEITWEKEGVYSDQGGIFETSNFLPGGIN